MGGKRPSSTEEGAEGAERLRRCAAEVFGWDSLLPEQLRAMEAVLAGRDTLVVMPTGSGKSAVYQVPGVLLSGPVVIVSPLLALQRDQIAGLPDGTSPTRPSRTTYAANWRNTRTPRACC